MQTLAPSRQRGSKELSPASWAPLARISHQGGWTNRADCA
jgi:hypothetical protein